VLRDDWKLDTGRSGLVEKLAVSTVKKAVLDNMARLKELLETGSTGDDANNSRAR
jgi:hypothetical protein